MPTANLDLPLILASQAQKHVTHNEALRLLDGLVQLSVKDRDLTAPPGSPANGDRYIVGAGATGAWSGWSGDVAMRADGFWFRLPAREGWIAWIEDENGLVVRDGSSWVPISLSSALNLVVNRLGLGGATPDATNRLSINSPASLFNNAGAGHEATINKAASGDDAAVALKVGFSARALMGLLGDDNFHLKVSPDGSVFYEALVVDRTNGRVSIPVGLRIGDGSAGVPALGFNTDTDCGFYRHGANDIRLALGGVDAGLFRRGNILGTVAQSGGVPTQALIEVGSNANGSYVRFADGTQICFITEGGSTASATASGNVFTSASESTWTFPAAFSGSSNVVVYAAPLVDGRWASARRTSSTAANFRHYSTVSSPTGQQTSLVAIGRWF